MNSFSDGLTEDIIAGLSRIRALRVVSRNAVFPYKDRKIDPRTVGRELGVRYVLEGGVRQTGELLRISARLIDAISGYHVWAERIELRGAEAFATPDDIASRIVASLQTQLILAEGQTAPVNGSGEHDTRLLTRSWQQFLLLTQPSLANCRGSAERALLLDPDSGMGHRLLAVALYHQAYMGLIPWTRKVVDEVHSHARISVEAEDADESLALGNGVRTSAQEGP